ncbi:MAG TPA: hypothetical protein VK816_05255 [Jatrophihabitantaceae bacterium]|nr:hypothetical protein [Jatrophihabitantaceae bacterium]
MDHARAAVAEFNANDLKGIAMLVISDQQHRFIRAIRRFGDPAVRRAGGSAGRTNAKPAWSTT